MHWYCKLVAKSADGTTSQVCGSDANIVIDGRCSRETAIEIAKNHVKNHKRVLPKIIGFKLQKVSSWFVFDETGKTIYLKEA
jgi:hypothetical protein